MKVWVLIDKYNGDIKAALNETGKRNVEKQLNVKSSYKLEG